MELSHIPLDQPHSSETAKLDSEAVLVYQRGFAVIDSQARQKKVGSAGLGSCIATVMYHEGKKVLSVAHIDGMTELDSSFATVMDWMKHAGVQERKNIAATMFGGDPTSTELRAKVRTLFSDRSITNVTDLNPSSAYEGPRKFVVSVEDGIIHEGIMPAYPEDPLKRTAKLQKAAAPTRGPLTPDYTDVNGISQGLD